MRLCRHCAHESADHLSFCSRCGHRFATATTGLPAVAALGPRGLDRAYGATAFSRTLVATPGRTGRPTGRPTVASGARFVGAAGTGPTTDFGNRAAPRSRLRWAAGSIGYIYVFLR